MKNQIKLSTLPTEAQLFVTERINEYVLDLEEMKLKELKDLASKEKVEIIGHKGRKKTYIDALLAKAFHQWIKTWIDWDIYVNSVGIDLDVVFEENDFEITVNRVKVYFMNEYNEPDIIRMCNEVGIWNVSKDKLENVNKLVPFVFSNRPTYETYRTAKKMDKMLKKDKKNTNKVEPQNKLHYVPHQDVLFEMEQSYYTSPITEDDIEEIENQLQGEYRLNDLSGSSQLAVIEKMPTRLELIDSMTVEDMRAMCINNGYKLRDDVKLDDKKRYLETLLEIHFVKLYEQHEHIVDRPVDVFDELPFTFVDVSEYATIIEHEQTVDVVATKVEERLLLPQSLPTPKLSNHRSSIPVFEETLEETVEPLSNDVDLPNENLVVIFTFFMITKYILGITVITVATITVAINKLSRFIWKKVKPTYDKSYLDMLAYNSSGGKSTS